MSNVRFVELHKEQTVYLIKYVHAIYARFCCFIINFVWLVRYVSWYSSEMIYKDYDNDDDEEEHSIRGWFKPLLLLLMMMMMIIFFLT